MPELPEVETTRRSLAPVLEGCTLEAEVRRPRMARRNARPRDVADRLRDRTLLRLGRHGKFIIGDVEGDLTLVVHLGMSGRFQLAKPGDPEDAHTHVVLRTDRGDEARMVDPRTFGFVAVFTPAEWAESTVARLGPDALDALPGTPELVKAVAGRTVAIKTLLLDQRVLAGLGNIYADEVLARARVRGDRPAGSLSRDEIKAIRSAIRPVLESGLRHGGTSLDDLAYLLPDGRAGEYAARLRVYGREDEPCRRCGTQITRTVLGGRSSFWCPSCQR
ncbi:MAG: bifunctional DNA-formamidopyrimidine glycosylase/DNA-(apurinic or apyrimidinic site) lyase [Acidimicrobiia bacterium]|nr:bifunctional DNA-formamidopyrimidine glycosylase/DNA-(apurinic or apyrimidinic site) lyase [Acidimicrobiia bacterium]